MTGRIHALKSFLFKFIGNFDSLRISVFLSKFYFMVEMYVFLKIVLLSHFLGFPYVHCQANAYSNNLIVECDVLYYTRFHNSVPFLNAAM